MAEEVKDSNLMYDIATSVIVSYFDFEKEGFKNPFVNIMNLTIKNYDDSIGKKWEHYYCAF